MNDVQNNNFQSIIDNFPMPYQSLDAQGAIIHVNQAWLDALGYSQHEVIGKSFSEFLAPNSSGAFKEKFSQFKRKGMVHGIEFMMVGKDGRNKPVLFDGIIEKDEKKQFKRTSCFFHDLTQLKEVESALRVSGQFSSDIFNSIQDGISILDEDLTIQRVNTFMERMYSQQLPIVGKKCYEVYQKRKTICPWCPSKRVLEDGEQHSTEVPYPSSEEEPIGWLELTSYPLKDSSGKISGIIEHVKDITEYKKNVKRITHLNKVLNAIRNVNQLIIHEKNQDILLQKVCDTLIETRGYSTAWIMLFGQHSEYLDSAESGFGKGFTALKKELNHGNFPACVRQALEQARPTEISDPSTTCADCPITDKYSDKGRMTIRLEHAKKVYGVLSVSFGVDITVDEEELSLFEEVSGDIAFAFYSIKTEQERDKAQSELLLKNLVFNVSFSANSIADNQGNLTYVNKAFLDIWGYSNIEEVISRPISDFIRFNHEAIKIVSTLNETGMWEGEYTAFKKDKSTFDAHGLATIIKDKSGNILGYQSSVQDISQKKQTERKLQMSEEKLRNRNEDLSLINSINTAANQGKELHEILCILSEKTRKNFSGFGATIYLLSKDKKSLIMQESYLPPAIEKQIEKLTGFSIPLVKLPLEPESFYQQALLKKKPQLINESTEIQALINEFIYAAPFPGKVRAGIKKLVPQIQKMLKIHSVVIIPLIRNGEVIGALDLSHTEMFTESDIARLIIIAEQITAAIFRVQAYDEIEQLGYQNKLILDSAGEGILGIGLEGEHTFVNPAAAKMLGYEIEELLGKESHSIWHHSKKDGSSFSKDECPNYETNRTGIRHFIKDDLFWRKDGTSFPVDFESAPVYEKKQIVGSVISFRDITERKESELIIQYERDQAQTYLDIAEVMIMTLNTEGEITLVNQKGARILGYQIKELTGKNWFDTCLPAAERMRSKKGFDEFLSKGEGVKDQFELTVITKSGEERIIYWNSTPLWEWVGGKKHIIGSLSSGEDITRRKRAEMLLNALNQGAVVMGTANTRQEIFNAVVEQLKQLDFSCILFPVDETQGKLYTKFLGFNSAALNAVEKLAGIKHEDFSFPIDSVDRYREVIREKKTLFTDSSERMVRQILPKLAKKYSSQIAKILRIKRSISAPLIVEDRVIGVFSVQSDHLTMEDIPAITAFADQLSSAWNKVGFLQNLRKTVEGTIHTIAATVETRDPYTAGHQTRVADLAVAIAGEMKLTDEQTEGIRMAGIIHDLGKIQVPAEILSKPGKLTELEFSLIKTHPQVGYDLLKNIEFPWPLAEMVLQHHEKMNGSGYPNALKGDEIMLEARILSVADIVEAMSSHRPYRPALGIEKALAQIKQDKGTLLDPDVVDACLKIFKEGYQLPEG